MYRSFTIAALMLLLGNVAGATVSVSTDGVWWATLTQQEKAEVMLAATDVYETAYLQGEDQADGDFYKLRSAELARLNRLPVSQTSYLLDEIKWEDGFLKAHPLGNDRPAFSAATMGIYANTVDSFYASHSSLSTTDFALVLQCIRDKPTESCEALENDFAGAKP